MKALLAREKPPTAVFAVSDRTALGAIPAINEAGLRVPQDISVVGFDDMPPDVYPAPALTTVTSERSRHGPYRHAEIASHHSESERNTDQHSHALPVSHSRQQRQAA